MWQIFKSIFEIKTSPTAIKIPAVSPKSNKGGNKGSIIKFVKNEYNGTS